MNLVPMQCSAQLNMHTITLKHCSVLFSRWKWIITDRLVIDALSPFRLEASLILLHHPHYPKAKRDMGRNVPGNERDKITAQDSMLLRGCHRVRCCFSVS